MDRLNRRTVLRLGALTLASFSPRVAAGRAAFQENAAGTRVDANETVALWPGTPPGPGGGAPALKIDEHSQVAGRPDRTVIGVAQPLMTVVRPAHPDGSAVLIAPGGGYVNEWFDREGFDVASRLTAAGVTCFILRYRLPAEGWQNRADVPLQDAQRAIRLIRANASKYGIVPERTGVMGFSAGGHLAASLATRYAAQVYPWVDDADDRDTRPTFAVLMYPVITMGPGTHGGSRDHLLGPNPTPAQIQTYSCEKQVTAGMPPCFICCAGDDTVVPPFANSVAMVQALHEAKVPTEFHFFDAGGHGFGIHQTIGKPVSAWPDLLLHWGASHKWFTDAAAQPRGV
jgi:acetyl esterase/lipase